MTDLVDPNQPLAIDPLLYEYSWDFDYGMGPWTTWMAPSVVHEVGGEHEAFTRLNAPGVLDPNHVEGVGALRLVAHLSIPVVGSPGALNLTDAEFEITIRATDFNAQGGKLVVWLCRYIPEEGVFRNYYVGLAVTNWANTGNDLVPQLVEGEWVTLTVSLSNDPADWTYAGENHYQQGETADRYQPFDLGQTLAHTDATLHLVMINDEEDEQPTGFLDIANITVRTSQPATPVGSAGDNPNREIFYGLEDQAINGTLAGDGVVDLNNATFSLVAGSETNGSVTIDPATGAFVWTPNANHFGPTDFTGAATFRYTVTDGVHTSTERTAFFFIGGINDAPTVNPWSEALEIAADAPFSFTLLKGVDVDRDERLTFDLVDGSETNGTVVLDETTGHYVFTPTAGFSGQASFTYVVSDGQLNSDPRTVVLTVVPPGVEPARPTYADAVNALTSGNTELFVRAVMLAAEKGEIWAAHHFGIFLRYGQNVVADPARAVAFLELASGEASIKLTLAEMYVTGNGVDRDYAHARALLLELPNSATAAFKLGVMYDQGLGTPQDDALAAEFYIKAAKLGSGDAALAIGRRYLMGEGVDVSATDAYFWLGVALKRGFTASTITVFANLVTFNMGQAVALGLTPEQKATLDGQIAAWTVGQASPVNDAPVAGDESTPYGTDALGVIAGTLARGTDSDGDRITYQLVSGSAQNGSVAINASTGAFVFTPAPGYEGPAQFSYVLSDGQTVSAPTVVSVNVELVTLAGADAASVAEVGSISVGPGAGLLTNDTVSASKGPLTVTAVNGDPSSVGQAVAGSYGSIVINSDGGYVFTASPGTMDLIQGQSATETFTYTVRDSLGVESTATVTITINGQGGRVATGDGMVVGSAFADILGGGAGQDVISGLGGNDTLTGGTGEGDELRGGLGDDTYIIQATGDVIVENAGEGTDTVLTGLSSYVLADHTEVLIYTGSDAFTGVGSAQNNRIVGGAGDDVVQGMAGDDLLVGGLGADSLSGGDGVDTVTYADSSAAVTVNLRAGTASGGHAEGDVLTEVEILIGSAFDDVLSGGAGNNRLEGGLGSDTVDYSAASAGVNAQLNSNTASNDGDGGVDTFVSIENLTGSAFNDVLIGDGAANVLHGGLGSDVLLGLAGADVLWGGAGAANTLQGGLGDDLYIVEAVGDSITEFSGEGTDTVDARVNAFTLSNHIENLFFGGTGDFVGVGNALNNIISGGTGNDSLSGGGGDDLLHSGAGVDVFSGGDGIDTVDYSAAASGVNAQLNSNAASNDGDGATDTFSGIENLTGSAFNDTLIGDGNANVLRGGLGADTLLGLAGNDVLDGGTGAANVMNGGLGDDVYIVSAAGDSVLENLGEGTDTVDARVNTYILAANVENLLFGGTGNFAGTGNALNNTITGGAGDDVLRGGGGVDVMHGGLGNDTIDYGLAAAGVVARLDLQRATKDGDGATDTFTSIENLTGSIHDDVLIGDNNANILMGGVGYDVLSGGGGDDILMGGSGGMNNQLIGGTGDDWYILDAFDSCVEYFGEGIDTVEARVGSYTLGANVENLLYTGPGKFVGNGNALDNVITGGALDDMLRGRGGNDIIRGGGGVDEVQFTGLKAEYTVSVEGSGYRIIDTVDGRDGSTYVESVERLRFLNGNTTTNLSYPPPAPGALETGGKGESFGGPVVSTMADDDFVPTGHDGPEVLPAVFDDGGLQKLDLADHVAAWRQAMDGTHNPLIVVGPEGLHLLHDRVGDHDGYGPDPWS